MCQVVSRKFQLIMKNRNLVKWQRVVGGNVSTNVWKPWFFFNVAKSLGGNWFLEWKNIASKQAWQPASPPARAASLEACYPHAGVSSNSKSYIFRIDEEGNHQTSIQNVHPDTTWHDGRRPSAHKRRASLCQTASMLEWCLVVPLCKPKKEFVATCSRKDHPGPGVCVSRGAGNKQLWFFPST